MSKSFKYRGLGLTTKERNAGSRKFTDYTQIYPHIYKLSDLQLLEHLVFLETLDERYKLNIGELSRNKETKLAQVVPINLQKQISLNTEEILKLKDKLGLFEEKEKLDAYQKINDSKKKFKVHREKYPLDYKTTCPFCDKIYFMMRRTKNYKPHVSPFFDGGNKILFNRPLMELYHNGKITKEDVAKVLGTSPDYVVWLEDTYYKDKK